MNPTTMVVARAGDPRAPAASNETFTVLEPRPGRVAERFARLFEGAHPAIVFAVGLALGFAAVAAVSIALGAAVTDELVTRDAVHSIDEGFVESVVEGRAPALTTASVVGSTVGSVVLVVIAVLLGLYFLLRRQWLPAAFALLLPPVESGLYRLTSMADPRMRPDVVRLEDLPVNDSYPSGHTAASLAVYGGLVLLLGSRIESAWARRAVWVAAALIICFVAMSRIYRGMHHPIDALGGALIGLGAIAVLLFACRAASAAGEYRTFY